MAILSLPSVSYGLTKFGDLFTPRQLVALTTFSDLVAEAIERCRNDYLGARASRPQKPWHTRGYLPHWEAGEVPQSLTFRLHDSLPRPLLEQWQAELGKLPADQQTLERRKRIEAALDQGHGECHLRRADIAGIVAEGLRHFDGERYQLIAWSIMPNHVHVLMIPLNGYSLSSILHSWKSFTAKEANRVLGRTGAFWLEEYFDRAIRDEVHFARTVEYIENNPVRAGLCNSAADWQWGSAWAGAECSVAEAGRAGRPRSQDAVPLDEGGQGALAYAQAVGVYLGLTLGRASDYWTGNATWESSGGFIAHAFTKQAIPMVWDFAEGNPFSEGTGNWEQTALDWVVRVVRKFHPVVSGTVQQQDAQNQAISKGKVISTDPPYYDNIGYADLSDYFYVWMRRTLRTVFQSLYATLAVPKAEELVATPYRHGGKEQAEAFFLDGMTRAIRNLAEQAHPAFPVTIYYAFKQSETKGGIGTSSTGWETFLDAVIQAGFAICGTWPMRTERANRSVGLGTNALASSIILVCRKRPADAPTVSRREFLRELNATLPDALDEMTRGGINSPVAPVDLSQAIIGPGMGIFSQNAAVLEADGRPISVRTALQLINRFLTEDDFDHDTQFCLHWFDSFGWSTGRFGDANTLAQAKGTAVNALVDAGVLDSSKGDARLYRWAEYPRDWSPEDDNRTPIWEALHQLIRALNQQGETEAGALLARMPARAEPIRALAYRLYTLCERKGWADDARGYNELVTAWSGIERVASESGILGEQTAFDNF